MMKYYIQKLIQSIESLDIKNNIITLDNINYIIQQKKITSFVKKLGAYFTEHKLATVTVNTFSKQITHNSIILDPTCGTGNLLIEASRCLQITSHLSSTLKQWGETLWGYDIHSEFIEITKLNLIIEALRRGAILDCSIHQGCNFLHNILLIDAMQISDIQVKKVTHLLMNPPFLQINSPQKNYWKKGKVNSAGIFLDHYLRILPKNCEIVAILPDILRSGSRYQLFRSFVSSHLIGNCHIWGRFSNTADIDVFILSGKKNYSTKHIQWTKPIKKNTLSLSEKYNVRIGPLVAYRDKCEGKDYPYFHSKNCKNWTIITKITERRAFKGKVIQPPCILIKRTSSPSDKFRAAAVLINLKEPIAVENHLIIVTPKDHTFKSCQYLFKILSTQQTNDFLNDQIRTRHLTVNAIKSIPL